MMNEGWEARNGEMERASGSKVKPHACLIPSEQNVAVSRRPGAPNIK